MVDGKSGIGMAVGEIHEQKQPSLDAATRKAKEGESPVVAFNCSDNRYPLKRSTMAYISTYQRIGGSEFCGNAL